MRSCIRLPQAKTKEIAIRSLPPETLAYDLKKHRAYCLNQTASLIWKHCNGNSTLNQVQAELERETGTHLPTELILCGLLELQKAGLLAKSEQNDQTMQAITEAACISTPETEPISRINRRDLIKHLAISSALIPMVASVMAPASVMAASCRAKGQPCGAGLPACCGGLTCTNPTGIGQCVTT